MRPRVSIIIPTFNNSEYLEECLDSVMKQSLHSIEIICIDDGSTDRTSKILNHARRLDSRLRLIRNELNLGAGESRNRGIQATEGFFVRFVDGDDLLPHESTEILYTRAAETGADLVRGSLATFCKSDLPNYLSVISVKEKRKTTLKDEASLWIPWWHTSYLMSCEIIHRNALKYPRLRRGEDPVFLASMLVNATHVSLLEDIVYLYRKYPKLTGAAGVAFADVMDFIKHAETVKGLFVNYHPECWKDGYGPFLLDDFREFVGRCKFETMEVNRVICALEKVWGKTEEVRGLITEFGK